MMLCPHFKVQVSLAFFSLTQGLCLLLFYVDIPEKITLDICSDQLCSLFIYIHMMKGNHCARFDRLQLKCHYFRGTFRWE